MNMAGRRVFSCRGFCQGWRRNCRNAPIRSAGRNVSVWCEQQPKATAVRAFAHGVTHHEAQSPLWLTGRCSARTALASTYIRRQAEFDAWARSCQIGLLLRRMEPVSVIKRAPVVILAAIAAAGCGGGGHKEFEIAGSWRGNLAQKGMHPFVVTATIRAPSPSARKRFTTPESTAAGAGPISGARTPPIGSVEVITRGKSATCKGVGTVRLMPAGDRLRYEFRGGGIVSRGILSRRVGARPAINPAQFGE